MPFLLSSTNSVIYCVFFSKFPPKYIFIKGGACTCLRPDRMPPWKWWFLMKFMNFWPSIPFRAKKFIVHFIKLCEFCPLRISDLYWFYMFFGIYRNFRIFRFFRNFFIISGFGILEVLDEIWDLRFWDLIFNVFIETLRY